MISSQQWDLWLLALCLGWNLSVYSIILHMLRSRNFGYIKVPENLPSHLKLNTELTAAELESKCVRVLVFWGFWFLSDVKSALCTAKMITHWSQCAPVALFSPCRNIWLMTARLTVNLKSSDMTKQRRLLAQKGDLRCFTGRTKSSPLVRVCLSPRESSWEDSWLKS